jgi:hypothetical protein
MAGEDSKQWGDSKSMAVLGGDTARTDSIFHQGNFMESNKTGTQKIKNLDAINEMKLPGTWGRFERTSAMGHSVVFRRSKHEETQISFCRRDRAVDEKSAEAFKNLVSSNLPTPRVLYSHNLGANVQNLEMFRTLASALGSSLVGDNQLAMPANACDSRQPAFHLDSARVETLNGKNVVAIDGWFTQMDERAQIKMAADGPVKRYYSGIFFNADGKGTEVDEIYLIADDKPSFVSSKATFLAATKSIKWQ